MTNHFMFRRLLRRTMSTSTREEADELLRRRRDLVGRLQPTVARCDWTTHPRYFGSIASHFLGFHEHFRQDLREVIDVAGDQGQPLGRRVHKASSQFESFQSFIHVHHSIEEQRVFPVIRKKFPHLTPSMDMLDKDHGALDGMFANVRQAFQANDLSEIKQALLTLQKHLLRHLEDEEDLLVPLMLQGHLSFV